MYKIFLPAIFNSSTKIGVQTTLPTENHFKEMKDSGMSATCIGGCHWANYETEPGVYTENFFDRWETSITLANQYKIDAFVAGQNTPMWAREIPDKGWPKEEYIDNYVNFILQLNSLGKFRSIQIFNEVDSYDGAPEHYGGWGVPGLDRYIQILERLQNYRPQLKLSVGLMGYDTIWAYEFNQYKELVDEIYYHDYRWYWPGLEDCPEYIQEEAITSLECYSTYRDIFKKNISITESNLLYKETSTLNYENAKAEFVYNMYELGKKKKIPMLLFYHWKSNWNNANIYGLPAWYRLATVIR